MKTRLSSISRIRKRRDDWLYCPKCGRAYKSRRTHYEYIRTLEPDCTCKQRPVWGDRPDRERYAYAKRIIFERDRYAHAKRIIFEEE